MRLFHRNRSLFDENNIDKMMDNFLKINIYVLLDYKKIYEI